MCDRSGRRRGADKTMKHGLGTTGNIRHSFLSATAYDSCAIDATFQKSTLPMKTSHNPFKQLSLCIRLHARCMKSKKRRAGHRRSADFRVLFAFFSRSSMLGILPGLASAHRSQDHFYQSANVRAKRNTRCRPPVNLLLPPL